MRAVQIPSGAEVLIGGAIRKFDRCVQSPRGSLWLVYWQEIDDPTRFQEEPVLTVWPSPRAA
jgi:hypothetical protein